MNLIRLMDNYFGNLFIGEKIGFTKVDSTWTSKSNEQMDRQEWEDYRANEDITNKTPMQSWLISLATREKRKFYIFDELLKITEYSRILELGAGQGHVGTMLNFAGRSTDLTEFHTGLLYTQIKDFNFTHFQMSFNDIDPTTLGKYDCVLAVQLDYMMDSAEIKLFLEKCAASNTDVIFVNTQIIGPLNYWAYCFKQKSRLKVLKKHGFVRSLGFYRKVGKIAGFHTTVIRPKFGPINSYYFLKFTKNG